MKVMDETTKSLLVQLSREASAVYVVNMLDGEIVYANEKCCEMIGVDVVGQKVDSIIANKPNLKHVLFYQSEYENSDWEYYDTVNKKMYKLRQICRDGYSAVVADDITDVLSLNCAVADYLRLMTSLSDMQSELISNQDKTLEILMKTLIKQFSAHAVYVSYRTRRGELMLWSLSGKTGEVNCKHVDSLPDDICRIQQNTIKAADITYEFRVVSPEPPELWNANHAIVMNMAGVYLESSTLREQIKWDNGHDKFTGLYNRAHYILTASERYEKLDSVGIVFLDIDNLKETNDNHGHHFGDMLIKKAADVLLPFLSDNTDAYRMGGDEFMLVLSDCTESDLQNAVSRLKQAVKEKNDELPYPPLLLSLGDAYSKQTKDMEAVIRTADSRMYTQKLQHKAKK